MTNHSAAPPSPPIARRGLRRTPLLPLLLLLAGCTGLSSSVRTGDTDELNHQVELYERALHWKDEVAAAAFWAPEKRAAWRRGTIERRDERDLSITSFDIEEVRLDKAGGRAFVKVSWVRLPSLTEKEDLVEERWERRDGAWLIVDEIGGPDGRPVDKKPESIGVVPSKATAAPSGRSR